jgi:hypothetical protein
MDTRSIVGLTLLSASSVLVVACAPSASDSGSAGTNDLGAESEPASSLDGLPDLSAVEIKPVDPASLPRSELLADLVSHDKVKNGLDSGFNDLLGNTSVHINVWGQGGCTAQVVNERVLLTAAHCVTPDWSIVDVIFTKRDKTRINLYSGAAFGSVLPNWRAGDKDAGVLVLPASIPLCQSSVDSCLTSQPDVPARGIFQYFDPANPVVTFPSYNIIGYGTKDGASEGGVLRRGTTSLAQTLFTEQNIGLELDFVWTSEAQTRPCQGDSGGALITTLGPWLVHTGIHSGATPCAWEQGFGAYSGLSSAQAGWVLGTIFAVGGQLGIPFVCSAGSVPTNGMTFFACQ